MTTSISTADLNRRMHGALEALHVLGVDITGLDALERHVAPKTGVAPLPAHEFPWMAVLLAGTAVAAFAVDLLRRMSGKHHQPLPASMAEALTDALIDEFFPVLEHYGEEVERRAQRLVAIQFFILAPYVVVEARRR